MDQITNQDSFEGLRVHLNEGYSERETALKFNGSCLIKAGDILTLAGLPGSGKSSVCEAIAASAVGSSCFGFIFTNPGTVLLIDTERTRSEVWRSLDNIRKRLRIGESIDMVDYRSAAEFRCSPEVLKELVESALSKGRFSTLIIDGILDFCAGMNDETSVRGIVGWLANLARKHALTVVTTLHPNKGTDVLAGHLGSFLYRYSRAILYVKKPGAVSLLTVDGKNGKTSYADSEAVPNTIFHWCEDSRMMVEKLEEKISDEEVALKVCKALPVPMGYDDAVKALGAEFSVNQSSARVMLKVLETKRLVDRQVLRGIRTRICYVASLASTKYKPILSFKELSFISVGDAAPPLPTPVVPLAYIRPRSYGVESPH